MKLTTQIAIGIRQVGRQDAEIFLESMTVEQAVRKIVETLLTESLARRIQISIARDETEAQVGLMSGNASRSAKRVQSAMGMVDSIFEQMGLTNDDTQEAEA